MSAPARSHHTCEDCGAPILQTPIRISKTEYLCHSCWPFLLKPLVDGEDVISTQRIGKGNGTFGPGSQV